jgi:hypothetical protein
MMSRITLPIALPLSLLLLSLPDVTAADKIPKAMTPKLLKSGKVVFADNFDGPEISNEWLLPKGEFAGTAVVDNGVAVIDSGAGRQGVMRRSLTVPLKDASVQLLMKPSSVNWMGVRFLSASDDAIRGWKIGTFIFANGAVRVCEPVEGQNQVIKGAKVDLSGNDWWRVCVEYKGKKLLVRINSKEVLELEHPAVADDKSAILLNLYGGRGRADEIVVMAPED